MGHDLKDKHHDYWTTLRQLHTPFYGEKTARDWFLHTLCCLHFADNSQRSEQGEEHDRLSELQRVFVAMILAYAKFYNPSENLAVDQVIVKFKGRVNFR